MVFLNREIRQIREMGKTGTLKQTAKIAPEEKCKLPGSQAFSPLAVLG
jgi:hypothetical protein